MFSAELFRRYLLDRMVLRPSRDPLDCGTQERMTYQVGGETSEYFCHQGGPPQSQPDLVVLKFPGTAGRAERASAFPLTLLGDVAGRVLTWNPPGYGGSSGKATLASIATSARSFLSHAIKCHVPSSAKLWLCGNSLGCNTVLHLASLAAPSHSHPQTLDRSIDGIVLRNPPPLVPVVKHLAASYPLGRLAHSVAESLIDEMNAKITAPLTTAPAVFLQSMLDSVVPPSLQNQLIRGYAGPHRVVPLEGLDHDEIPTDDHEVLMRESLQWLWQSNAKPNVPENYSVNCPETEPEMGP